MTTPRTRKQLQEIGTQLPKRLLALGFVETLLDLPEGFRWKYDQVEGDNCGCAISVAHHVGLIEGWTPTELATVLGLDTDAVYKICYDSHVKHGVKLDQVTPELIASEFQRLIG